MIPVSITPDDLPVIERWLTLRGRKAPPLEVLPPTGLWIRNVAAGWLYKTDGEGFGILEHFVSNPEADWSSRRSGLDIVASALLDEAAKCGVRRVMAFTRHQSIYDLAVKHGFSDFGPSILMVREV
jgi:hypothetical protein